MDDPDDPTDQVQTTILSRPVPVGQTRPSRSPRGQPMSARTKAQPRHVAAATLAILTQAVEVVPGRAALRIGRDLGKDYKAVNQVLEGLGGKWSKKERVHLFALDTPESLAEKFDGLKETGTFVSLRDLGFFPTPPGLADQLVALADVRPGMKVLEPSAGTGVLAGRLAKIVGARNVVCGDLQSNLLDRLRDAGHPTVYGDFLTVPGGLVGPFDRIVMNPPFAGGQDVSHVTYAFLTHLKTGGRLAAVTAAGWTFRQDKAATVFRELVARYGRFEKNPPKTFVVSGTAVETVTVVLDKPE
jgi:protein-L-isoaspartate O-methyltransferase